MVEKSKIQVLQSCCQEPTPLFDELAQLNRDTMVGSDQSQPSLATLLPSNLDIVVVRWDSNLLLI
jgi:hypothetical protein